MVTLTGAEFFGALLAVLLMNAISIIVGYVGGHKDGRKIGAYHEDHLQR